MLGMRLSARADYALRAAIELASATDGHVTADRIARAQQIPGKFLETILTQLRRAGLIRSQRGPEGGFWLARPAAEISLAEIIRAIDGPLLGVRGERPENIDYPGAAGPLQQVWIALRANERAILEEVTLAHIVSGELPARVQALTENPQAWVLRPGPGVRAGPGERLEPGARVCCDTWRSPGRGTGPTGSVVCTLDPSPRAGAPVPGRREAWTVNTGPAVPGAPFMGRVHSGRGRR